jgi:hypothetical protein
MMDRKCKHETLRFENGGYYIVCDRCLVLWIAIKDRTTTEFDPDRATDDLSGDELRIDLTAGVARR